MLHIFKKEIRILHFLEQKIDSIYTLYRQPIAKMSYNLSQWNSVFQWSMQLSASMQHWETPGVSLYCIHHRDSSSSDSSLNRDSQHMNRSASSRHVSIQLMPALKVHPSTKWHGSASTAMSLDDSVFWMSHIFIMRIHPPGIHLSAETHSPRINCICVLERLGCHSQLHHWHSWRVFAPKALPMMN